MAASRTDAELEYESKHVHEVYEDIACHFSSTRYKVRIILQQSLSAALTSMAAVARCRRVLA